MEGDPGPLGAGDWVGAQAWLGVGVPDVRGVDTSNVIGGEGFVHAASPGQNRGEKLNSVQFGFGT